MAEYLMRNRGQSPTMTTTCDGVDFDKSKFRGGRMILNCRCTKHDGMQHECRRTEHMGKPECLADPAATYTPSVPRHDVNRTVKKQHHKRKAAAKSVVPAPQTADIRARRRAARNMLQRAVSQYDDRPAAKKFFTLCRIHCNTKADNIGSNDRNCNKCTGQGGRW